MAIKLCIKVNSANWRCGERADSGLSMRNTPSWNRFCMIARKASPWDCWWSERPPKRPKGSPTKSCSSPRCSSKDAKCACVSAQKKWRSLGSFVNPMRNAFASRLCSLIAWLPSTSFIPPTLLGRLARTAMASSRVGLPEPFSPTKKATGTSHSICKSCVNDRQSGNSAESNSTSALRIMCVS